MFGDWMIHAACRGHDPELWFPTDKPKGPPPKTGPRPISEQEAAAKAICATCPVIAQCRAYAEQHPQHGIWAGVRRSDDEAMRNFKSAIADLRPCGTLAAYRRHARRGEKPCRACLDAHYQTDAYRRCHDGRQETDS